MRLLALALLALAFVGGPSWSAAAEEDTDAAPPKDAPPPDITLDGVSGTVTGTLQGKDGLRIQTLCTHCNSANIAVGGLASEFSPISVDGYPIFEGLATSLVFSILPSDTIAGAKVLKGPGAAASPSRTAGGQILLDGAEPDELPFVDVTLEGGTYDRRHGTARVAGSLSSRISASLVVGHDEADPVDDDHDGFNDVADVDREFAEGRMTFSIGRNHTIDIGASWIDEDDLDGRGGYSRDALGSDPAWTREDAIFDREEYRAGWQWDLGQGRSLGLRLLDATRHQTQRSEIEDGTSPFDGMLYDRFLVREDNEWGGLTYGHAIGLQGRIEVGFEAHEQKIRAETIEGSDVLLDLQFPGLGFAEPQRGVDKVTLLSGYVDFEWTFSPKWNLRLGGRYDDAEWEAEIFEMPFLEDPFWRTERRDRTRTTPRTTLRFRPTDDWTLKLIAGGTFRTPKPILAEICCGQRYQRNVNTAAETGESYGFEGIYQPSPDLRVSVYAARSEFDDHILRLVAGSQLYIQTYALANVPETRADTAEIAVRWSPIERLALDGSMGWLSHHNENEDDVVVTASLQSAAEVDITVPIERIPYQPVRTGSMSATVTLPRGASVTGQAAYTGSMEIQQFGDPFEPLPADAVEIDPPFVPNYLRQQMRSTPGFWLVNLSFEIPLGKQLVLVGGGDNLTDRLQNDLDDPMTDFNWGPLSGRSWRLGLRYRLAG